jgi:hypothetical protein
LCTFASLAAAQEAVSEPTQDPTVPYRLFRTQNIYTFIKLDTRDGRLWQVQWGMEEDHRFTVVLSSMSRASGGRVGRFTLYPTSNIYTFILLDQDTGDARQVQWGDAGERLVFPIKQLTE